jgi:DNA-binding GntR family transcriptional regulator
MDTRPAELDRRDKKQAQYRLANLILDIVRTLRLKAGHHVTEQWLAEELSVSRTPVRSALKLLAERGIVEARPNHGFFLAKSWSELDPQLTLPVPATPEEAFYTTLLRDRMAGDIADSITQTELARRYRSSRFVLLRVLGRMADEGLVARNKGQGWSFLPTLDSARALRSSYDFRVAIEPAGLLLTTFLSDQLTLKRLRADHEFALSGAATALSESALFELDSSFHETLAGFSGNPHILQGVQQHNRLRRLFEYQGYGNRRRVRDWVREHLDVIACLQADDRAGAAERLRAHLDNALAAAPNKDTSD